MGEARHVFIEAGFNAFSGSSVRMLEMGFGSGLNCWLTLLEAEKSGRAVEYVGVEKYPVSAESAARLEYSEAFGDGSDVRFAALHAAPWGEWTEISAGFRLLKVEGDLTEIMGECVQACQTKAKTPVSTPHAFFHKIPCGRMEAGSSDLDDTPIKARANRIALSEAPFDVVFWDAFSPDTQPELWTPELFAKVHAAMAPGGVLTTYSAKGDVRRALQSAGFAVEKLQGALGKRHMLRANITNIIL